MNIYITTSDPPNVHYTYDNTRIEKLLGFIWLFYALIFEENPMDLNMAVNCAEIKI